MFISDNNYYLICKILVNNVGLNDIYLLQYVFKILKLMLIFMYFQLQFSFNNCVKKLLMYYFKEKN